MYSESTQAVLLLSTFFGKPKKGEHRPLTAIEYGRFARWLHENGYTPDALFHQFDEIAAGWRDPKSKITEERLQALLSRGAAMGLALEKWQRAGIWLITRQDAEYPKVLKQRLRHISPPVLFGVGNKSLLNAGGLAVIGSRGIDQIDQNYTESVAKQAASETINIVSGAARGVDETAMLASLQAGGTAVGVMADSLFKAATASKWRQYLQNEQLVLISSCYPEASFNVGNAMGRNKHIYALSDFALVVRSDKEKGGTWAGAKENLENQWVPLMVKKESDATGNQALLNMGGIAFEQQSSLTQWMKDCLSNALNRSVSSPPSTNLDLFS